MHITERAASLLFAAAIMSVTISAGAAESISPAGPIGGTDIRSALLPPPGNYIAGVAGGIDVERWYTDNGDSISADGHVYFAGAGMLHVYDQAFLSGTLGSTLYLGVQRTCFGIASVSCASGLQDIYSDIFAWSKFNPSQYFSPGSIIPYGTAYWVGLGLNIPAGNYDKDRAPNIGSNFFTVSPNVGITHTFPSLFPKALGEATELSARLFFNYYTENRDTDYQSGYVVSLDFAGTQRSGPWQYGITGTTYQQLNDDKLNGAQVANGGSRAASFSIGPLLAYDFSIDGQPYSLMAKFLTSTWGENTTGVSGLTLRLATQL
ncbi:SphA family protein [Pseudomonas putida]|uniref:SphA family protein n=1 Tax=Pseudomonas putida TaxID=303 RepID=UPI002B242FC3|nr:transporter [Pseudomonas putida]